MFYNTFPSETGISRCNRYSTRPSHPGDLAQPLAARWVALGRRAIQKRSELDVNHTLNHMLRIRPMNLGKNLWKNLCESLPFHSRFLIFVFFCFRGATLVSPSGHDIGTSTRWDDPIPDFTDIRGVQFCRKVNEADPNWDDFDHDKMGISWVSVDIYIYIMDIWIYGYMRYMRYKSNLPQVFGCV